MKNFDVVMVGAGAAGLFCAGVAAQQGLQVLLLDHSEKVAEKIRISGGGRSNFTNRELDVRAPHKHFLGDNPQFCRSALSRYTPQDFVGLMQKHNIPFHEKHKGQLFCDRSSEDLIQILLAECNGSANGGSVTRWQPCSLKAIRYSDAAPEAQRYQVDTGQGTVHAAAVVVATGGLSIPKIGATDMGYRLAKQFNLRMVEPRPGLVPLTFDEKAWVPYAQLSGLSLPVRIETGSKKTLQSFDEDLLFTHRGLSGPGVLQISSYWQAGTDLRINLAPEVDLQEVLMTAKQQSKKLIANELNTWVPSRLADTWASQDTAWQRPVIEASDKALNHLAQRLSAWPLTPTGTEGYKKAEVTVGGVDTRDLSQQTMESKQPGLYFIGEVVDITGWLGGYNFQWAWASAHACAKALGAALKPAV
ncbi:NAD(P)/FAD-dependent oxidoreductase [Limnohabitans sp.]|uniref:NAD(P)/FAD-dependent oxidoreductase n=1 Tax=Limnohabitans sp. TaxID=1907725 RepID=UPI00333F28EE